MAISVGEAKTTAMALLNRLSPWLFFLALLWLCWGLARLLWLFLAPPLPPNLPSAPLITARQTTGDVSSAFAIFANPQPAPAQAVPPPNVTLAGVMTAHPKSYSSALLSVNGVVRNYRVGDTLDGSDYAVIEVDWDKVILANRQDQQIVLEMPKGMPLDQNARPSLAQGNEITNRTLMPPPSASAPTVPNLGEPDASEDGRPMPTMPQSPPPAGQTTDTAAGLEKAAEQMKQNPAAYLSQMGVMATGDGYQVTDAMPENIRSRLGLQSGDRVVSVNGKTVGGDPIADADVLNQVKQSGQAMIEVKRGDQVISIRQQF